MGEVEHMKVKDRKQRLPNLYTKVKQDEVIWKEELLEDRERATKGKMFEFCSK